MGKTKFYKIAALAITLSIALSSTAFAATQSNSKTLNGKKYSSTYVKNNKKSFNFKSQLDSLVTAGTITQAQEDAAIKLLTPSKDGTFQKGNNGIKVKLDGLVTAGTITQAQEDAIVKLETTKPVKGGIKTGLDGLVTAGTITQAQEDTIVTLFTPTKGAGFQRENNGIKVKLDGLVTAGTITQAQEDAMLSALTPSKN
jgi:cytochrome c-type biogenesis protein CcmE